MAKNLFDVEGKVVIVTGSTKGLGRAFAQGFAERGARVVVSARDQGRCDQTVAELQKSGDLTPMACHVGDWDAIPAFVDRVYDKFGRVDVVINNAGINPGICSLTDMTPALWDKVAAVNVKGPLRLSSLVAPRMGEQGGGSIINVASIGATRPHAKNAHYDSSKAALVSLSQVMAMEWAPLKVRVNIISPGTFRTPKLMAADPKWWQLAANASIMQRLAEPEECVGIALYLASDASSFVTAANHVVSGGIS